MNLRTLGRLLAAGLGTVGWGFGAPSVSLRSESLSICVEPDGCGFVDEMTFRDRVILRAEPGFGGAEIHLTPAPTNLSAASVFARAPTRVLRPRLARTETREGALTVEGQYTDGAGVALEFHRRFSLERDGRTVRMEETVGFDRLPTAWHVCRYVLRLPLVTTNDPHWRLFGFGCEGRAELFRMDMNDLPRRNQLISAPRAHWPYWDLGGVVQWPGSYRVWKANHADTPAYPLQEGRGAPGWADYSERDWGLTVNLESPMATAPWSVTIDARAGVVLIEPWPALQPPVSGPVLGRRRVGATWIAHDTSWPATIPCELDFATYRALLLDIGDFLDSQIGTSDPETIMFKERIQPSTILRLLYRGDAWRMQGRLKAVGIEVPRVQPFEKWEADAQRYLDILRERGLPASAKPGGSAGTRN